MGGEKKNRKKIRGDQSPHCSKNEDYNVSASFSKVRKYRGSNPIQTESNFREDSFYNPIIFDNASPQGGSETKTSVDRNDYYNLDNKISTLTSQNNEAHEGLRKEFERKIDTVLEKITQIDKSQKSFWKWFVGISVTIILAFGTWLYNRLALSNENKERIEKIEYKMDETIIPLLNKNTNMIERNTTEIRELYSSSQKRE